MSDRIWLAVQEMTRPKNPRIRQGENAMEWQDQIEELTASLEQSNILSEERRCILRKRNLIRQEKEAFRLVCKYRRRPAQTFEKITASERPPKCELSAQEMENFYSNRYVTEKLNLIPIAEYISEAVERNISMRHMTLNDVKERILRLKTGKSAGPDRITYEIWQIFPCLTEWLYSVFKACEKQCRMPQAWRISRTILLYKKGQSEKCKNWRPINLQNTAGKIYTATIEKLLQETVEERNILSGN